MHVATVTDIKSLHLDELRGIAEPSYRAGQITDWLYQKRVNSFAEMTDLPQALRTKLADDFSFDKIEYFARPRIQRYDAKISLSIERRQSNRIGPDSSIARALRIALGSSDDLRFDSGRLRVRLQILRKRAGWLETKSACG